MTERTRIGYIRALNFASEDFETNDPVREAFENIANYLADTETDKIHRLTFGMLRQAAKLAPESGEILHKTIAYLTGARADLLKVGYEYIDDQYGYVLQEEEVDEFLANGEFFDPRTGRPVPDADNFIYIFFKPNYAAFH